MPDVDDRVSGTMVDNTSGTMPDNRGVEWPDVLSIIFLYFGRGRIREGAGAVGSCCSVIGCVIVSVFCCSITVSGPETSL